MKTSGELPAVGSKAPDFKLVKGDLSEISLSDFAGEKSGIEYFPEYRYRALAPCLYVSSINGYPKKENTVVLCVSKDLPFAASRFCGAEGLDKVITASDFRYNSFALDYGVLQEDGPLKGPDGTLSGGSR